MSKKKISASVTDSLLVELLTEELPPKSLKYLSEAFGNQVLNGLVHAQLKQRDPREVKIFATPRRLAVVIPDVKSKAQDRIELRKLMPTKVAFDDQGKPSTALLRRLEKEGLSADYVGKIERSFEGETEYVFVNLRIPGAMLISSLEKILEEAIGRLPMPKIMSYQRSNSERTVRFVRPVHELVVLHGSKVVNVSALDLKSSNKTRGHRFLSKGMIVIRHAKDYEKILKKSGKVIASFQERHEIIRQTLDAAAKKIADGASWSLGKSDELVDEVTSLVEYPVVLAGSFDPAFLEVPKECLIISMQQHQKYFPLADAAGKLLPRFLFVSNMKPADPKEIIHGNERVLRARLSDAKFFFDQDRRQRLADRLPRLGNVVYHNKLGSQLERVQRLEKLSGKIAQLLKADMAHAERAAQLSKADLLTDMVGEFPELQGIMGRYYAKYDHEPTVVADAVEQHYWPRTAGGELPKQAIAVCVALADKLDTLVGIYGIGLVPTGEKDPFGLRRAALGVVRILVEKSLALDVVDLLTRARGLFPNGVIADGVVQDLHGFMLERLKPYLKEKGFEPDEIDAVVSLNPTRLEQVLPRLQALQQFRALPEAQALAAANKRIRNILRQAGGEPSDKVDAGRLTEPAERKLAQEIQVLEGQVAPLFKAGNYTEALKRLAGLRPAVDEFFDKVMVMADDSAVRNNRLALLNRLSKLFLNVADISRLQS